MTTSSGTPIQTQVRSPAGCPSASPAAVPPLPASRSPPRQAHQRWGGLARPWLNVDDAWCEALFASAQRSAAPEAARVAGSPVTTADQRNQHGRNETVRQIQVQRRPPRRADGEPPRAEYHDPAIRRARQATARAARKTR